MELKNEFEPIRKWAYEKGIYNSGDTKTQYIKFLEESGELAKAILKKNDEEFIDAIGDCVVVLVSIVELYNIEKIRNCNTCFGDGSYYEDVVGDGGSRLLQNCDCVLDLKIEDCINSAYEIISKRTGKMVNGTFVKNN